MTRAARSCGVCEGCHEMRRGTCYIIIDAIMYYENYAVITEFTLYCDLWSTTIPTRTRKRSHHLQVPGIGTVTLQSRSILTL